MDGYQQYRFVGVNRLGQTVRGHIKAKNMTLAKIILHRRGVQAQKIKSTHFFLNPFKRYRIKPIHITQLTLGLARLLQANIPLLQALELLKCGETNPRIEALLCTIQTDIQSGLSLADALKKHPKYFSALFCHMVQAGELSGTLKTLLRQLSNYREARDALRQKIKKSLAYPTAIIGIACTVTLGLLLFVVPQFQQLFESFNAHLPAATLCLIQSALFIKTYGLICLTVTLLGAYCLRYLYTHTPRVTLTLDTYFLKLPFTGSILRDIIVTRLTQTLSILLKAGMPLTDAVARTTHITNNACYTQALLTIQNALREGHPLQAAFENTALFPSMMTQIIGMGEASGQLTAMLTHFAEQQDETLKHQLDVISSLFEPFLMAVLGLWIGGLIVALYLPIFQLGAIIS
ncbi:MAG: type II secretion system F family protein [Legionellaceae bacterium]|nr:type II secretion system F family protein [Legionellaceae bacterium]